MCEISGWTKAQPYVESPVLARSEATREVTEGLQRLLDAKGEKLCSGCQRLAPPAGYFVSPAQSRNEKRNPSYGGGSLPPQSFGCAITTTRIAGGFLSHSFHEFDCLKA